NHLPRGTARATAPPLEPRSIGCRPYHEHAPTRKTDGRNSRYAKGGHRRVQHNRIPANSSHRTQRVHNSRRNKSANRTSNARRRRGTKNRRHKDLSSLPPRSARGSTDRSLNWTNNPRPRTSRKSCLRHRPHPPRNQESKKRSRKHSTGPQRIG